jgi:4-hydroxy-tetrahydrodipicolinate reductase
VCARHKKALVIGTTGHTNAERNDILKFKTKIPMVWTANFSTGVNTLFWLTRKAAEILGPDFDLEITEMHHRMKMDAPSGTAKMLAQILAEVRKQHLDKVARHGRLGIGERAPGEIGIHSLRGGDVVGDHTVIFAANGERIELTHKASSRDTFANGALRAAIWVAKQKPGLYDMQDVLGLKLSQKPEVRRQKPACSPLLPSVPISGTRAKSSSRRWRGCKAFPTGQF